MKPWIHEDILKTWTDAQKRLWESLCSAVPLQPPMGVEAWRETYLQNLASWEAAVQQSLEQEAAWVEEWVRRVAQEKGTPEMMASWVRQMEEVLQRWIQTQNQWWNEYFALLRRGGFSAPGQSGPKSASTAKVTAPVVESVPTPAPLAAAVTIETVAPESPITVELPVAVESPLVEPAPPSTPEPSPAAPVVEAAAPIAEAAAPIAEAAAPVAEAAAPPAGPPDDLKLINGIGPALEKKLKACGVIGFRDLATLSDADIERIEAIIKFAGRIRREDWIGQARAHYLHKYGQPL